ncbi:hypothetical protein OS493_020653 [Desmophyllum pertusum]|uniref:Uncharacterized protein n=1 Tax=Desmophyllum pertusum TaxID=174260 RepID=A0A9W9Z219_9CNID|nr:hypothetical protein OS493_020653 [Desmophyllum pertusum]
MDERDVQQYLRRSSDCYSSSTWTRGQELHKLLVASVTSRDSVKVEHNTNEARPSYEILYLQTPYKQEKGWVQIGMWTNKGLTLQTKDLSQTIAEDESTGELPRLRAAVVEYPPLTMKADFDATEGCHQGLECMKYIGDTQNFTKHCCYGLAIDVLRYVKTELQFEPLVYFVSRW